MGELARLAGLSKQTISSIEAGEGNPTIQTLEELAGALGVTVRSLLSEMGSETLVRGGGAPRWQDRGRVQIRELDQAFGSGYVYNSVLRLRADRGVARMSPATLGTLRHCYVLEGRVRLGLEADPVTARTNDFVRFSGDAPHLFEALTPIALVLVCTTSPQLSMADGGQFL